MNKNNIIARVLRKNQTPQETKMWNILRNQQIKGMKFRRQYPIGNYIVDFVCKEIKLVIEIDGGQHNFEKNIIEDDIRTNYLKLKGYNIIRFWNNDVDNNIDGVYEKIVEIIEKIKPSP
jgi:very-short-patch-repair endonuclease